MARYSALTPDTLHKQYEYTLWATYGITVDQWLSLWARQEGRCGICFRDLASLRGEAGAVVDHSHQTFLIRGLLCGKCNGGLYNAEHGRRIPSARQQVYLTRNAGITPANQPHPERGWLPPLHVRKVEREESR